jgi:hypothetical protein
VTPTATNTPDLTATFNAEGSLTPLPTDTNTPTITPTFTATPDGPAVVKRGEGNENNNNPVYPGANLWICDDLDGPGPLCDLPGEGNLIVFERAFNVFSDYDGDNVKDALDPCICTNFGPDGTPNTGDDSGAVAPPNTELGLGAYEFSVEYDNFVIQSVNPCDIVFGPGGAGQSRGPVDEVDSSDNPYCDPDPDGVNNGTCALSLILENIIHFGCVTNGQTPQGPTGEFELSALNLIPHPDLKNDIFPGNNNGVLTVIKDNGCELVDTLGHPVWHSVNGGLTPTCADLAVTVRILEGDLDLDCDVDITDEQLISFRYGAFFGSALYSKWFDLEPELHDLDIDIKDVQKVFGRDGSTCQEPIPAQPPLPPPTGFGN